jgi:hypothetical protein
MPRQTVQPAVTDVSLQEARGIAIRAAGLTGSNSYVDTADVLRLLGIVQLDAINVVSRAHHLTIATRLMDTDATAVDRALWGWTNTPLAFEYAGHAASLIPIDDWPIWAFRRRRTKAAPLDWRPSQADQQRILDITAERGPVSMRELRGEEEPGAGWDWGPTKTTVEYLVWSGELVCSRRRGWHQRLFDLPERVIPERLRTQDLDDRACVSQLVDRAARVLGIATLDDLADYLRVKRSRVEEVLGDVELLPVRVESWRRPAWTHPSALSDQDPAPLPPATLLNPFDNLIWYRARVTRLFGFDHVLEAYKPAGKRKYGYYACPLLVGDRLVGRADLAVQNGALAVLQITLEEDSRQIREGLELAMFRLATITGTDPTNAAC